MSVKSGQVQTQRNGIYHRGTEGTEFRNFFAGRCSDWHDVALNSRHGRRRGENARTFGVQRSSLVNPHQGTNRLEANPTFVHSIPIHVSAASSTRYRSSPNNKTPKIPNLCVLCAFVVNPTSVLSSVPLRPPPSLRGESGPLRRRYSHTPTPHPFGCGFLRRAVPLW